MSIRTINYTVTADSITPASLQRGGLQGEHNATELIFKIENSLAEKLEAAAKYIPIEDGAIEGELYYRFEAHTCMGMKNSTLPVRFKISDGELKGFYLNYSLENWLTREGGNITVYLIFSILSDGETHIDIFSYPARLKLESVPDGKYTDGKNYESVAKLSVAAEDAAERAEEAAEISKTAKEQTVSARFALENGAEFIFLGGDASGAAEVDLVVDGELSEHSSNPISNEAVAKNLKKYISTKEFAEELQKYTPTEQADEMYVSAEEYASDKENADIELSKINEDFKKIADYKVEQGTIEGWTYEKWNSGKIECYCEYYHSILGMTADGAVYGENIEIPLPNGLFNTKPTFACGNVDISGSVNIRVWQSTNTKLAVRIISTQQYGVGNACTLLLYAVGKWK